MKIEIEKLIEIIVKEVISELSKLNFIDLTPGIKNSTCSCKSANKKVQPKLIDMSNYKTPILTENHLLTLDPTISEIIVPKGTIITPGARDIIKRQKLVLNNN